MTIKNFINWFISKIKSVFSRQLTFSDLVFGDHPNSPNGVIARLDLGNNLEISVVAVKFGSTGFGSHYGSLEDKTYEVAVFHNNNMIPLRACDDVRGWQTEDELTELMGKLQGKPQNVHSFIDQLHLAKSEKRSDLGLD